MKAGGKRLSDLVTAVQLRFDLGGSPSLPEDVRARRLADKTRRGAVKKLRSVRPDEE